MPTDSTSHTSNKLKNVLRKVIDQHMITCINKFKKNIINYIKFSLHVLIS